MYHKSLITKKAEKIAKQYAPVAKWHKHHF